MRSARAMTDAELEVALANANRDWDDMCAAPDEDIARGGSPFEWLSERIDEIETELRRRTTPSEAYGPGEK